MHRRLIRTTSGQLCHTFRSGCLSTLRTVGVILLLRMRHGTTLLLRQATIPVHGKWQRAVCRIEILVVALSVEMLRLILF